MLKNIKEYPAERMELDSATYSASCALANYEAEGGDPHNAVQLYEQLLDKVMVDKPDPYADLEVVTKLSRLYEALSLFIAGLARAPKRRT